MPPFNSSSPIKKMCRHSRKVRYEEVEAIFPTDRESTPD